jgi:hypothetical protein
MDWLDRQSLRAAKIMAALDEYKGAVDKVRELLTPAYAPSTRAGKYAGTAHNVDVADEYAAGKEYELLTADGCARDAVLTFLCNGSGKGMDEVMDDGVDFLDDLDFAIERAKSGVEKAFRDKGHPYGAHGNPAIDLFYFSLVYAIRSAGGNVATSRTAKSSPKHISKALDILRDCLPKDFPKAEPWEDESWAIEKAGILVNRHLRPNAPKKNTRKAAEGL